MRWVSMVPSWTETLIECGAQVVGRTRFCIHPSARVAAIPAVGGTKDFDPARLTNVKPDLLLLDREENPKSFFDEAPCRAHVSHVQSVSDLPLELGHLAEIAQTAGDAEVASRLLLLAERWSRAVRQTRAAPLWASLPGVMEWLTPPPAGSVAAPGVHVVYVIWKNPWMCAAKGTFIASMLQTLGLPEDRLVPASAPTLYPSFEIEQLPPGTVVLLSSEPFPFHKQKAKLLAELQAAIERQNLHLALVNGESFSWFGLRALRFLEGI